MFRYNRLVIRAVSVLSLAALSALPAAAATGNPAAEAERNGKLAAEALARSNRVMRAWLERLDPVTGLLPRTGDNPVWYVRDSAADLYPFMAMAAWFTERNVFGNEMLSILRNEIRYSTRLGRLSDNVAAGGGFEHPELDADRVIFGSCEYAKDGLLPLTELLNHPAFFERLRGIADDMIRFAPYNTPYGRVPSDSAEVNGEFLQVLSRLAHRLREPRYTEQIVALCDLYFNEIVPRSNGLPAHLWDFENRRPASDAFNLADHGNEIAGGLSEAALFLKETGHPRADEFVQSFAEMIDILLECGLNDDGVWYSKINLSDRSAADARHAHCWGYLFNAVYTAYLLTDEERYLNAAVRAMDAVTAKPTYLDDPDGSGRGYGSNAYSDALESYIVFLNRMPTAERERVLDECALRFLRRQREDGIIEDWYGDGNYIRTALMYAFLKSQGAWIHPWRKDVRLGAAKDGGGTVWRIEADAAWNGRLAFDTPRSREHFNLPVNYTRLNEFPEWFTVNPCDLYRVTIGGEVNTLSGAELARGLDIALKAGESVLIRVSEMAGPPYGNGAGG